MTLTTLMSQPPCMFNKQKLYYQVSGRRTKVVISKFPGNYCNKHVQLGYYFLLIEQSAQRFSVIYILWHGYKRWKS